jgi:hypothetical protein
MAFSSVASQREERGLVSFVALISDASKVVICVASNQRISFRSSAGTGRGCSRQSCEIRPAPSPVGSHEEHDRGQSYFWAQQSRFCERAGQKIIFQRQFAGRRVTPLQINGGFFWVSFILPKNLSSAFQQLAPPVGDLQRVDVKQLCQFG